MHIEAPPVTEGVVEEDFDVVEDVEACCPFHKKHPLLPSHSGRYAGHRESRRKKKLRRKKKRREKEKERKRRRVRNGREKKENERAGRHVGSSSAPLPVRQYRAQQRHRREQTTSFASARVKEAERTLMPACVVDTIVAATAVLTGSPCDSALVTYYLLQLGKRYRHLPCVDTCLNFGSPETSCYLVSFFVL